MARYLESSNGSLQLGVKEAVNTFLLSGCIYVKLNSADSGEWQQGDRVVEIGGFNLFDGGVGVEFDNSVPRELDCRVWCNGGATIRSVGTLEPPKDVWFPIIFRSTANGDHTFWLGSQLVGTYTSGNIRRTDNTYIGVNKTADPLFGSKGAVEVADFVLWDVILTDAEIAELQSGAPPYDVRPLDQIRHWPIDGDANPEPESFGNTGLTVAGITSKTAGPVYNTLSITATALSTSSIRLAMTPAIGATAYHLYRGRSAGTTTTLVASWTGAAPPGNYTDSGLQAGTAYYYRLVAVIPAGNQEATDNATTDPLPAPDFSVGGITERSGQLGVPDSSAYLEVEFVTTQGGVEVDREWQVGTMRWTRTVTGLAASTEYKSRARCRMAAGLTDWSVEITWSTYAAGFVDPDSLGCPPGWPGVSHNPDGNPWDRWGRGFYRPLPGEPLRGQNAEIIFRYHLAAVWDIFLSDDAGATYPTKIASNLGAVIEGTLDDDRLYRLRTFLDTTGLADGQDYRLKAVSKNLGTPAVEFESMTFPVDNAEEVRWWKAPLLESHEGRWGNAWAQTQKVLGTYDTGEEIWKEARDGGIAAIHGHDHSLLVDLDLPKSLGADVTARFYIWSGEGGMFRAGGRADTETLQCGIGFLGQGDSEENRFGLFVGIDNLFSWLLGCCNDYLTSTTGTLRGGGTQTPGGSFFGGGLAVAAPNPCRKLSFLAIRKPYQVTLEEVWYVGAVPRGQYIESYTGGAFRYWPEMMWRRVYDPSGGRTFIGNTCARRWEVYSLRARVELDPGDHKRVRVRARLDGPGIEEPAAGYWHQDEWIVFGADWEEGVTGFASYQVSDPTYSTPAGARVLLSWSALPLVPGEEIIPGEIPVPELAPWAPPQEGAPCTVVLQVFEDDRERVAWEVGTASDHENPFLLEPENYGEQEIDPVEGAATIGQAEVIVIDRRRTPGDQDTGWLTYRLAENSISAIHGRRCRLLRYIDPGLGWVVIADGPASTPRMDPSYSAYRWAIRDTRETERKVRAFVDADTSWLLPMGVEPGFGAYVDEDGAAQWLVPPAEPLTGTYSYNAAAAFPVGTVEFRDYWPGPFSPTGAPIGTQTVPEDVVISSPAEDALIADAEEQGDPRPVLWTWPNLEILWRAAGTAEPWTVIQPTDLLPEGRNLAKPAGTGAWYRNLVTAFDAELADGTAVRAALYMLVRGYDADGTFPRDGQEIDVAVRYRGEPTEDFPLHIEGITAGDLLKRGYDGEYSYPDPIGGGAVPTGIRYNTLDLLQVGEAQWLDFLLLQDGGRLTLEGYPGSLALASSLAATETPTVLFRVTAPVEDFREWAEQYVYSPTGWIPALNNDGEISPKSQVPPESAAGLTQLTDPITEPAPEWDAGERIVNNLRYTYPRWYRLDAGQSTAVDRLTERTVETIYRDEASITRHSLQGKDFPGEVFAAIGDTNGKPVLTTEDERGAVLAEYRRLYVFDRYRNGAVTIQVPVRRDYTATLRAGDFVIVDHSWFPDYVTRERGLLTMCQILAIRDVDCEWRVVLAEEVLPITAES